jgi:hypothetical protein
MSVILSNFNHERWMVTGSSMGSRQMIVEECLKSVVLALFGTTFDTFCLDGQVSIKCSESLLLRSMSSAQSFHK